MSFISKILGNKDDEFHEECSGIEGREYINYRIEHRTLAQKIIVGLSMMVIAGMSAGYIGNIMLLEQQPGFMIRKALKEVYAATDGRVSGRGKVIYPALEDGVTSDDSVRPLFFPDKSNNKETTVYMYLVGSNLEDSVGSASINLAQIKDATAAGEHLRFIVEAGGTGR